MDAPPTFSYWLALLQEITALEYYLHALPEAQKENIPGSLFLGMLGSDTLLVRQHSVEGDTRVDRAVEAGLEQQDADDRSGPRNRSMV